MNNKGSQNFNSETALHLACFQGELTTAKAFVSAGADVYSTDDNNFSPIYCADLAYKDIQNILISRGAVNEKW